MTVLVFSDASRGPAGFADAYLIGGGYPTGFLLACDRSTDAENLAASRAVVAARKRHPKAEIVAHTDLETIGRGRSEAAKILVATLQECRASIVAVKRGNPGIVACHRQARIEAGVSGTRHPLRQVNGAAFRASTPKQTKKLIGRRESILHCLSNYPTGASEVRIAQETSLGLGPVHKLLGILQAMALVKCERPPRTDLRSLDLGTWIWSLREETT